MTHNRHIILHAGLPKTGTTSIQTAFYEQRALLLEQAGILYPSLEANLTNALCTLFHDDPRLHIINALHGVTTPEALAAVQRKYRDGLEAEILSTQWETLILSAEGVSNLPRQALARLRDWGNRFGSRWTVIFCLRHPVDFFRSHTQELLKMGWTLERLYEHPFLPLFRVKIDNLIATFGRPNVVVYSFEAAIEHPYGIVGAFAEHAGVPGAVRLRLTSQEVRENPSLSHEAVLLLDSMNRQRPRLVDGVPAPRRSGHELQYLCRIRGESFRIPPSIEHEARTSARADIQWLKSEFGLDLYPDVIEDSSQHIPLDTAETPLRHDTLDDLANIIADLVATTDFLRNLEQGQAAASQGDVEAARARFLEAARLNPDAPQPRQWLSRLQGDVKRNGRRALWSGWRPRRARSKTHN